MAFTAGEFFRGAMSAWLWFLVLSTLGYVPLMYSLLPILVLVTTFVSLLAAVVGSGPAYLIGRALRSVRATAVHVLVFAVYGLVLGVVATAVTPDVAGDGHGRLLRALRLARADHRVRDRGSARVGSGFA
jgi:hypothetical protein